MHGITRNQDRRSGGGHCAVRQEERRYGNSEGVEHTSAGVFGRCFTCRAPPESSRKQQGSCKPAVIAARPQRFQFQSGFRSNNLKCLLRPDSQVRSHKASCVQFLKCTLSWTWLDRLQASHWPVRASPCAASLPASRGAVCFLRRYFGTAESTMSPSTCGGIYLGPEYFLCRYFGYIR